MLMELAAGGDLFDKIGELFSSLPQLGLMLKEHVAPDVGVGDVVAHWYFGQLLDGMVGKI
jgi:serine/threonine-protein kinase Chk1